MSRNEPPVDWLTPKANRRKKTFKVIRVWKIQAPNEMMAKAILYRLIQEQSVAALVYKEYAVEDKPKANGWWEILWKQVTG